MKKLVLLLVLFPSFAFADSPREAFEGLHSCLRREADSCGGYFTEGSQPLYKKVMTYDLARCVPDEVSYVSELSAGGGRIVRAKIIEGGRSHIARLNFTQERGMWKMNLPETLKRGLGEKWQNYVNATEQAYLFMQQQLGTMPDCEAVSVLANQYEK